MEELEPRPMSQAGHDRVDREREMHEAAKKEKGWFGSLQKRLAKRVPGTKKKDKGNPDGEVAAMPNVAEVDEVNPADNQSISSISSPERPNSARDVALAGTVSEVSSDNGAEPARAVPVGGGGLGTVDAATTVVAAGARYADSDSSSTSSEDLYTAEPRYKGLTSATYNPGLEDEGLGMPALVPEARRRYSTSSDSSLESGLVAEKTFGEAESKPTPAGGLEEGEGRETFGNRLAGMVKKSFEGFAKEGTGVEAPKTSTEPPTTEVVPPTPIEEELKGPIMPAAAAEGSARASMDSTREKRSSRFSEIL